MNKSIRYIIGMLLGLMVSIPLFSQEILYSRLSKDTILIGDQIKWETKINVPKEFTLEFDSLPNPVTAGVELIGKFRIDTISIKKNVADICATAILTSFDSGSFFIPSRIIDVLKDGKVVDTLHINSQFLEVTTVPVDTANFEMFDIKPQYTYPVKFKEVIPWIGVLLLVIAIAWIVFRMVKNRKENRTLFGKPIVIDPPHIIALRALEKIRGEKLWQNHKEKQFYTEITDAVRIYIEGRYSVQAMERTSNEILETLQKEKIPKEEFGELKELFFIADMVKFAKYKASEAENERAIPSAVRFVNATFLQEMEEQKNG